MNIMSKKKFLLNKEKGFTLIELMVTVLIVSLLGAIIIPQYKHAVAKSRYKAMFPLAKSIYEVQDLFYISSGSYAQKLSDLEIDVKNPISSDYIVSLRNENGSSYTLLDNKKLNNTLVVYNKNSKIFPNYIFCEAKADNRTAIWLCEKGMNGTKVEEANITHGYILYAIKGKIESLNDVLKLPHESVSYDNQSGTNEKSLLLINGDTCSASNEQGCQHLDSHAAECSATGSNGGCAYSSYDDGSTCNTVTGKQGCADSTFKNGSICNAGTTDQKGTNAGCQRSSFVDSACYVYQNNASNKSHDTACGGDDFGGHAKYDNSK